MGFDFDLIDDSYYTHCCLDDVVCEQTFQELLREYECGDADPLTTYRLGKFYINGIGVEEDPDEGIRLVTESAESGRVEAQNELGRYYDAGEIVEQDLGEAFKWFSKAADQDMSAALFNLGRAYHCVFSGNPGTGKTTVARILAKIYQATGVVKTDKFVEAGREDLVAEWLGQTAVKTNELIDSALDGVLFIDEAYSLANLGAADNDSFGREAIETSNPGLKSRFTRFFEFGNARDVRKLYEETVNRQAERIDDMDSPTERQMRQLRVSDVPDAMP